LIGFGASAMALTARARPFGLRVSAVDIRDVSEPERQEFNLEEVGKPGDIDRLLQESDYVSLHLHLNAETRHILNARRLGLLKPTACLINVARGALVDEEALYERLAEGRLGGAALDVFASEPVDPNNPLIKLPNVIATPHISGTTNGTSRRRAKCVATNVNRIAEGLEPLYRIDL
jgi:phosphoglycerate dehydrogenase-like enzyme